MQASALKSLSFCSLQFQNRLPTVALAPYFHMPLTLLQKAVQLMIVSPYSHPVQSLCSQAAVWQTLDISTDQLLCGSEMPESRCTLTSFFNTVTRELARP